MGPALFRGRGIDLALVKRLITAEVVDAEFAAKKRQLQAPRRETIVTPAAWSRARELGVRIVQDDATAAEGGGSAERRADASGVVVVKGGSVQLGEFPAAGPGKQVRLADVITGKDRSPMTAGFMEWSKADSFPWTLDYDEVDYVVEGVLHVIVDGRVNEAKPGDVVYLPKGSKLVFGTPSRVKVFYVTYPADWAAPKK